MTLTHNMDVAQNKGCIAMVTELLLSVLKCLTFTGARRCQTKEVVCAFPASLPLQKHAYTHTRTHTRSRGCSDERRERRGKES